jgi:hypothetical protein
MNGFPILRVAGILLGGLSLVLLSRPAFGIQFAAAFEAILDVLSDNLSRFFAPLEYWVVVPVIEWLRSFNLNIPHPAPYWHHAFVLLWLWNGTWARNWSRGRGWGTFLFVIIWGGLTALVAGAATGTVPLNSWAMFAWPAAGCMAFMAGDAAWDAARGHSSWWTPLLFAALVALFAYMGFEATKPIIAPFGLEIPSPGLLGLAGVVGCLGVLGLIIGPFIAEGGTFGERMKNSISIQLGLDIVCAFGIAITVAAIGLSVPG